MSVYWVMACSVCFGDPNSPLSKGAIAGVILLMSVVCSVLGGIAATAIVWARQAKKLSKLSDQVQRG